MCDRDLREFLGVHQEYSALLVDHWFLCVGDSGVLNEIRERQLKLEKKIEMLFEYLNIEYQTKCREKLPKINKKDITGREGD